MKGYSLWFYCAGLTPQIGRVPNVKFNVAKVLQSLIPIVDPSVSDIFGPFNFLLNCIKVKILSMSLLLFPPFICSWWELFLPCRWWRKRSDHVWLSWVRTQMWMSGFLPTKQSKWLIIPWNLARKDFYRVHLDWRLICLRRLYLHISCVWAIPGY